MTPELNRSKLQFGNYKCGFDEPLYFVAEGYGRCEHSFDNGRGHAWKFGQHDDGTYWTTVSRVPAFSRWGPWDRQDEGTIEEILAFIQDDIDRENAQGSVPQPLGPSYAEWCEIQKEGAAR